MKKDWTEEEKREVERYLRNDLNPKEIGELIGRPRNAVCGMIWRTPFLHQAQKERVLRMSHGDRYRHLKRPEAEPMPVTAPSMHLKPEAYDRLSLKIPLMELGPRQCKFIVGSEALFCGHQALDDQVYCAHHFLRCRAPRVKAKAG